MNKKLLCQKYAVVIKYSIHFTLFISQVKTKKVNFEFTKNIFN